MNEDTKEHVIGIIVIVLIALFIMNGLVDTVTYCVDEVNASVSRVESFKAMMGLK